ncbi:auxin response factor 3-like isoform X3 [Salvia splendens]|uniref:auxin response factor 3-like isoform X3 n=1 Tax=Salvia splendens TaxID=180675 RepID=UPI001C26E576|nr:auxin response factor 3-like isoform X3 [Salvia splendens]
MVCGMIDLNTVNNDDETASPCGSPSSAAASGSFELAAPPSVSMELWHACAGPLISLPRKGSAVVYFPQGHVEHLPEHPAVAYDLPPHVFCRVVDVKLHADAASDEVYAQVSLISDQQQIEQKWREGIIESETEDEDHESVGKTMTPHMFCKTLTASDTSTHGGFSVPRRAAEDCFPALDYKQQRPSQELVAKDLHGIEWKFRHIYRGQPRRHLLTTGWSAFVNKKKLVSGDAVLFLRGGDGELRLGIRRATQIKTGATTLPPTSQQFNASSIAAVVNAITTQSTFDICYNPRVRSSDIIVPHHKFCKSLTQSFSCGMRFKIRFEAEDSSERSGLIVGVSDVDPASWPGSKWKCLLVRWDDMEVNRLNRVSPWEIELAGPMSGSNGFALPGTKRNRTGFPAAKPDAPIHRDGNDVSDFGEPLRFQKVLQGQEVFPFGSPYAGGEGSRNHLSDIRGYPNLSGFHAGGNSIRQHHADTRNSLERTVAGESFQFRKVLQGQETTPILSYGRGPQEKNASNVFNGMQFPRNGSCWSTAPQYNVSPHLSPSMIRGLSPSIPLLQQANPQSSQITSLLYGHQNMHDTSNPDSYRVSQRIPKKFAPYEINTKDNLQHGYRSPEAPSPTVSAHRPLLTQPLFRDSNNFVSMYKDSCRLFGFPLTEGMNAIGKADNQVAPSASAYGHGSNEEQLYQPPLVTKVMASSCTKPSDMHAVRDRLLDIAL